MQIKLHPTACLNEIGKRDNNEDSIFPVAGYTTAATRLFMVCDGVGGSAKGEEASRLACQSFAAYCEKHPTALPDADYINAALQYTEAAFDASLAANPNQKGMGTTVTLLCLHAGGITAAHIGDSRIYHVRKGEIKWATSDHSLVNDYLKAGILTPETAINHPQKNVITRALQGASVRPTRADVHIITDIAADDYIFMCTDGILESLSEEDLCRILGDSRLAIEDQIAQINNLCSSHSRDNFSCYLIKTAQVEGEITPQYGAAVPQNTRINTVQNTAETIEESIETPILPQSIAPQNTAVEDTTAEDTATETIALKNSQSKYMQIALGIILAGIISFFAMNYFKNKPHPPAQKPPQTTTIPQSPPENHSYSVEPTPVKPSTSATAAVQKPKTSTSTLPTANTPAATQTQNVVTEKPVPAQPKEEPKVGQNMEPKVGKLDPKKIREGISKETGVGPPKPQ